MKKSLKYVGAVAVGVIVVEFGLSYMMFPVANLMNVVMLLCATFVILGFVAILFVIMRQQHRTRAIIEEAARLERAAEREERERVAARLERERERERQADLRRAKMIHKGYQKQAELASGDHQQVVQVLGVLSARNQQMLDTLIANGASLGKLSDGSGFALVKPNGTYAPISVDEARYVKSQLKQLASGTGSTGK